MFVRRQKYEDALQREEYFRRLHGNLQDEWNALIRRVNKKGGETFLLHATITKAQLLTPDEITKLVQLCHPDKHDGKPMAVEMTQKLLELKRAASK